MVSVPTTILLSWFIGCFLVSGLQISKAVETPSEKIGNENVPAVEDNKVGEQLFERNCAVCHGIGGRGGKGPSLNRSRLSRVSDELELRSLIETGIPPEMPDGTFLTADDVAVLANYVRSLGQVLQATVAGDAARGEKIYAQSGCSGCHMFKGIGMSYGPDLTRLVDRRSASYVSDAVKNPRSTLPADFLMVEAAPASGSAVLGIRANEDTFSVQIKDSMGQFHSFRKQNLKNLKKLYGTTPMPAFGDALSDDDIQDLVAYLFSSEI